MEHTTLVFNVGSSSVKFAVARHGKVFFRGLVDHFGKEARVTLSRGGHHRETVGPIKNLGGAFTVIADTLERINIRPTIVAHRIVHGGQRFAAPSKLTSEVIRYLHTLIELAPLHQPANLLGVAFAKKTWPKAQEWGVFDTAIYRHLPASVKMYALPEKLVEKLHIEKYGFHGLSHNWALHQATKKLQKPVKSISVVSLHLGSGASMTLWHNGQAIDTTMGFTPLEGLVMSTRSGDIDPAIPLYIQEKLGWSAKHVENVLEQHSGLVGLSGMSDMRDILGAARHPVLGWLGKKWTDADRARAKLALNVFSYHIRKTLAGYLGLLDHVDAIIFTGPVGENTTIQKLLLSNFPAAKGIRVLTVHADEEQAIVDAVGA